MMSEISSEAVAILAFAILTACATPVEKSRLLQSSNPEIATMLSWKPPGKDWHFSLVPGSREVASLGFDAAAQFVFDRQPTAVGVAALKKHLITFYAHRQRAIYWEDYPPAGFRYPDKLTRDIERFAGANDIHLQLHPVLIE